jgi:DNA-binding ferritin-like protein (Dps family)
VARAVEQHRGEEIGPARRLTWASRRSSRARGSGGRTRPGSRRCRRTTGSSTEIQKYLFKVGPVDLSDGKLLPGIVEFFEQGAAAGTGVLDLIRTDVAVFCDDLIKDCPTYADVYQQSVRARSAAAGK